MSPLILDYHGVSQKSITRNKRYTLTSVKYKDVRRLVDIEFHAFENERVNQVLSYRDYKKPAHFERTVKIYQDTLLKEDNAVKTDHKGDRWGIGNTSNSHYASSKVGFKKIVNTVTNEIISFTKYEMKTYSREELGSPFDSGHEGEPNMNRDWFGLNERLKRQYIGTAEHCYVGMLATEPKHQHNGAGTMLLEEILAEADDAGVEAYLEATDTAKPLYAKHGFEEITELRFDPAQYGIKGLGIERQTVMVRGALGPDGERMAVRSWEVAVAEAKADLLQ